MIQLQAALFWAYGTGATFALSAGRQLQWWQRSTEHEGVRTRSRAANPYLALTVAFAAVLLAPTAMFLLWLSPSWATMHVADAPGRLWAGWVLLESGGIVVGALLGFLAAQALVLVGAGYWAYLQTVGAHFLLFAVEVHGWDGDGWKRALTVEGAQYRHWADDSVVNHVLDFLTSGTFLALLVLGAAVVGVLLLTEIGWLAEGWRLPGADDDRGVPRVVAVAIAGAGVYGLPLLGALAASALVRLAGWGPGLAVFAGVAGLVLLPRRSPVRWLYGKVGVPRRHWRADADLQFAPGPAGVTSGPTA
ncbi:hypothetical protein ABT160_38835 [Streptomyces sp. NPDC001941]|uniref:hypothetical protein n=1 Tax=Streptomyces sp. NPDC001941 TaxID=3154659 RepID=UPI00331F0E66